MSNFAQTSGGSSSKFMASQRFTARQMTALRLPDEPTLDRDAAIASMAFIEMTRPGERDVQRIWERTLQELDATPPP